MTAVLILLIYLLTIFIKRSIHNLIMLRSANIDVDELLQTVLTLYFLFLFGNYELICVSMLHEACVTVQLLMCGSWVRDAHQATHRYLLLLLICEGFYGFRYMRPVASRRQFPHPTPPPPPLPPPYPSFSPCPHLTPASHPCPHPTPTFPPPAPTLSQFLTPCPPHLPHHTVRVCSLTSMSIAGRANWRVLLILIILILYCCHL